MSKRKYKLGLMYLEDTVLLFTSVQDHTTYFGQVLALNNVETYLEAEEMQVLDKIDFLGHLFWP